TLAPVGGGGAAPPPPAPRRRARRSRERFRAALRGGLGRQRRLEDGRVVVLVVEVPPAVARGLRVALGRVLPVVLAAQRGHVEIGPGAAERLVAARVDEVGAEDPPV